MVPLPAWPAGSMDCRARRRDHLRAGGRRGQRDRFVERSVPGLGLARVAISRLDGMYFIGSDYRRKKVFPLAGSSADQRKSRSERNPLRVDTEEQPVFPPGRDENEYPDA